MTPIEQLDLLWTGRPRSIATALFESDGTFALVDPGPSSTLSTLRERLQSRGLSVTDLDAILLTHIHFDHAGAAGSLVRENPGIEVFVHSRGAPHMADPAILMKSAQRLYGDQMDRLFGEFLPVPEKNLSIVEGGETLTIGSRDLEVLYTPGHASHHVTYLDSFEGVAFVGDATGICVDGAPFVLPATPPPDIHLGLWNTSLDAILERKPARLFLTHFGFSNDPANHIARYRERLNRWSGLAGELLASHSEEEAARAFLDSVSAEISGALTDDETTHYVSNGGLGLSWQGLARYHQKFLSKTE